MVAQNGNKIYRIAVDAMGGDYAPAEMVKGAVEAARQDGVELLLVGDPQVVEMELAQHDVTGLPIHRVPSDGVIREGEHPVMALRQTPRASVAVAAGLVKEGRADAFVTLGSTGAAMASAVLALGLLPGLERPTLGGPFLGLAPKTCLIDLGSSVDCRPGQLLSFAVIGSVYASKFLGIKDPRVALLSVGVEEGKGNRQVQEAYALFKSSGLNFAGNVEGFDLFLDKADVVVCDGFVGNILLKYSEGLGRALAHYLRKSLKAGLPDGVVERMAGELQSLTSVAERAGGPLFGIDGVAIVGHGSSRAPTVRAAIQMACQALDLDMVSSMREELARVQGALPREGAT